jgi:nucleoside phosphorylase/CheY-like chemotaxis protein
MNILILEDEEEKRDFVVEVVEGAVSGTEITCVDNFFHFHRAVEREDFDLVIVDLIVPQFPDGPPATDNTQRIIEAIRDLEGRNFLTPVVAITRFDAAAEENFRGLNKKDINVVTYDDAGDWKKALSSKVHSAIPEIHYEFVVVCALQKEMDAFRHATCAVGNYNIISGLACHEIDVEGVKGVIVTAPRMGLVSTAITATRAIDLFSPKLVCMSGICAGVEGQSNIYDIVVPEMCHQHDHGKWGRGGFQSEQYGVQITNDVRLKILQAIEDPGFKERVAAGIVPARTEIPEKMGKFDFSIRLAPTSSGSAVIASKPMAELIDSQHRKISAFEMESFAIYESARLAKVQPMFFSAKSVVDDGGENKGDDYHRIACITSARTVCELIPRLLN